MLKKSTVIAAGLSLAIAVTPLWAGWQDLLKSASQELTNSTSVDDSSVSLMEQADVVSGLKEALAKGAQNAVQVLGKKDGFMGNALVQIPMPQPLSLVDQAARQLGQGKYADDFIASMNSAAEQAVPEAASLLAEAIRNMSVTDAMKILNGADDAATQYFREVAGRQLATTFQPIVSNATNQEGVTAAYKMLNKHAGSVLPVSQNPVLSDLMGMVGGSADDLDVDKYISDKTLDGLFKYIALEEKEIRQNPSARSSALLQKIFL